MKSTTGNPNGLGEIAMAIYNGLTQEYGKVVRELEHLTGKTVPCINMVGGGIQDKLLCELTGKEYRKEGCCRSYRGFCSRKYHHAAESSGRDQRQRGRQNDHPQFLPSGNPYAGISRIFFWGSGSFAKETDL
ncbi:MAG: hypothetical protein V8S22_08565 [Lachnospiraceae bacterium]